MNLSRKALGERIKAGRKQCGMTQGKMASLIAISANTLSSYETGDSFPSIEVLAAISRLCGISIDRLVFGKSAEIHPDQQETDLIEYFRECTQEDKAVILHIAELAAKSRRSA